MESVVFRGFVILAHILGAIAIVFALTLAGSNSGVAQENELASVDVIGSYQAPSQIEQGAETFKQCRFCHKIRSPEGVTLVKGGSTGPNLYGVVGSRAGTVSKYRYGSDLRKAGQAGLVWDRENLEVYLADPMKFLREERHNVGARSKMTYKLLEGRQAVIQYIESMSN